MPRKILIVILLIGPRLTMATTGVEVFRQSSQINFPKSPVAKIVYLGGYALSKLAFSGQIEKLVKTLSGRHSSATESSNSSRNSNTNTQKRKRDEQASSGSGSVQGGVSGGDGGRPPRRQNSDDSERDSSAGSPHPRKKRKVKGPLEIAHELLSLVRQEDVPSMFSLGEMVASGILNGTVFAPEEDTCETAAFWYKQAADAGHVWAMVKLADFLNEGLLNGTRYIWEGESQYEATARWLLKASQLGCMTSAFNLGLLHMPDSQGNALVGNGRNEHAMALYFLGLVKPKHFLYRRASRYILKISLAQLLLENQ